MTKDLTKALETVEMTYGQIKQIADDMLAGPFEEPNRIVEGIKYNIESMSIEMLRDSILRLQLTVYSLGELRDRSGIKEMEKMVKDGKKSIGLKMLEEKSYNIIEIPSEKKRIYLDSDYTVLMNLKDGE